MRIETARLVLRPFEPADIPAYAAIRAKPHVVRYLPGGEARAAEADAVAAETVPRFMDHWRNAPGYGPWALEEKASGRLLGHAGLRLFPDDSGETEVLYLLDDLAWGRGFATEAATTARDFGFGTLGLPGLIGYVHPDNRASERVLQKIGMARAPEPVQVLGLTAMRYTASSPRLE